MPGDDGYLRPAWVIRLSVRDCRTLGVLAPADRSCATKADADGQHIAVWHDPEGAARPAFELYDADTGQRRWRRPVNSGLGSLHEGAVVSSDPVVLALQVGDLTRMRRFGVSNANPGPYVGRPLKPPMEGVFNPLGRTGGVLVGTYGKFTERDARSRMFAYDLESGAELWSRPYPDDDFGTAQVAGVDRHGVLVGQQTDATASSDGTEYRTWITRWDLRTGETVASPDGSRVPLPAGRAGRSSTVVLSPRARRSPRTTCPTVILTRPCLSRTRPRRRAVAEGHRRLAESFFIDILFDTGGSR